MEEFKRGLYSTETEKKYFFDFFDKIEEIHKFLHQMPTSDKVRLFSDSIVEEWFKGKDHGKVIGALIWEIYARMKFLYYTNVFKTTKLIDGLISMYNSKNYLGWTLFGRSVLEHSTVLYYFVKKLQNINLLRNNFRMSEIEYVENILIQYTNGSRFDWDTLLSGNIADLTKDYQPNKENKKAVNILTALSHLAKKSNIFKDVEIAYSMFSDFVHPNMASHSFFINLSADAIQTGENELSLNVNNDRGEFVMVATLEVITYNLGNIMSLLKELSEILKYWLGNVVTGQIEIKFDE